MVPEIEKNFLRLQPRTRILIAGASGGLGRETLRVLAASDVIIGAHYFTHQEALLDSIKKSGIPSDNIRLFQADLSNVNDGRKLVEEFVAWAGGIDVFLQLSGGICEPIDWDHLTEIQWQADFDLNLTVPFFMAQTTMRFMQESGGKIILTSTASARHGGGANSMAYGVAKAGIECLTKGLARVGAPNRILVNAVCPGFIDTPFHSQRMQRTAEQLRKRAQLVPLKRAGQPEEVAGLIAFLVSDWGNYITGECIAVSGGDWL